MTLRNGRDLGAEEVERRKSRGTERCAPDEELTGAPDEVLRHPICSSGAPINPSSGAPILPPAGPTSSNVHQNSSKQAPEVPNIIHNDTNHTNIPLPFPVHRNTHKKQVMDKETLEMFSKVEINIPLLDAIKQIPRYAKFLKELCTNRRRSNKAEQVQLGENVSAVLQRKVPPKCGDPGTFTVPCTIGRVCIPNCMLDLGAAINVLPYSLYCTLGIGPLKPAGLIIQLADRSCKQPVGVIEDVLVQVGELVFPADFYILKTDDAGARDPPPILLGRPFLMTARTKIDCFTGSLSMEVEGEVIHFNIYHAMKHPSDNAGVHALDALDDLSGAINHILDSDALDLVLRNSVAFLLHKRMTLRGWFV